VNQLSADKNSYWALDLTGETKSESSAEPIPVRTWKWGMDSRIRKTHERLGEGHSCFDINRAGIPRKYCESLDRVIVVPASVVAQKCADSHSQLWLNRSLRAHHQR